MKAFDDEIHKSFIEREAITLRNQYALDDAVLFDPSLQSAFRCPDCGNDSLVLDQVHVTAICKADCGHEYEWLDSETAGCPRCGYRPHRFQTEHEPRFADRPRSICWCPCSSSTDAISHVDAYCPKCGELPDEYQVDGVVFCGIHYERLLPYELPANFLFIENESRWVARHFPNGKLWGDASVNADSREGSYCPSCESDHQRWLQSHVINDGEQSGEREPPMTPDLKS
jgi:predicted nucleic-acid-binding Zn-ribbon protein